MFSAQFHSPGLPFRATQEFSGNAGADAWWERFPGDWVPAGKGDATVFFCFSYSNIQFRLVKAKVCNFHAVSSTKQNYKNNVFQIGFPKPLFRQNGRNIGWATAIMSCHSNKQKNV